MAHREDLHGSHTLPAGSGPRSYPILYSPPQAVSGALLRLVLDLAGPGGVPGAQECAGHRGCADCHLDGPLLLPPAATPQQYLPLSHLLHQEGGSLGQAPEGCCILILLAFPSRDLRLRSPQNTLVSPVISPPVHPPEELQGVPKAVPSLQFHLLLPTGVAPGLALGCGPSGLRDQQVMGAGGWEADPATPTLDPHTPVRSHLSSIHSSWDCGLFTNYSAPWQVVPELVTLQLPLPGQRALRYLSSHAFSFPLLILLR